VHERFKFDGCETSEPVLAPPTVIGPFDPARVKSFETVLDSIQ
jgi:hypothetical protein